LYNYSGIRELGEDIGRLGRYGRNLIFKWHYFDHIFKLKILTVLIFVILIMDTEEFMNTGIKKTIIKLTLFLAAAVFSFADDIPAADDVPFNRVQRIDWNLAEVRNGSTTVIINRAGVQREIYSIRFMEGRIRGRGADNIYFAPCTAGVHNTLSIGKIAGTYMSPLFETENFSEYEYFRCLEKVYRWEFRDYKLRLYSRDENNEEVILEFIPIYK